MADPFLKHENGNVELIASHSNHRGDIIARSDEDGSLTSFALYEAYGTRPYEWGTDPDRQKANTKEEESDLGLIDDGMRYRTYDGVYLTRDPIGYTDGPNVYCYVHCNPITHFDALGLEDVYIVPAEETKEDPYRNFVTGEFEVGEKSVLTPAENFARNEAQKLQERDPDNTVVISASSVQNAKDQLLALQESGVPIDSLNFMGEGNENGQYVSAAEGRSSDNQLTADKLESFYDGINIEEGGSVNYDGCEVAKGEKGSEYLEKTAEYSGRRATGYETLHGIAYNSVGTRIHQGRESYKGFFGEPKTRVLGPAKYYQKYSDPGQSARNFLERPSKYPDPGSASRSKPRFW